jgi:hypothetical protein
LHTPSHQNIAEVKKCVLYSKKTVKINTNEQVLKRGSFPKGEMRGV